LDESKRRVIQFSEKEIRTYTALALFLSKKGIKDRIRVGGKEILITPTFYKERMKETKKVVGQLRKSN
jgi:hypothetical protein